MLAQLAAQPAQALGVSAGWYLIPTFRLTESYDDNIFGTSTNRTSDFITRFTPGLQTGYRSEPLTVLLSGNFESDVFAKNPDLNDAVSAWHVGMSSQYLPIRPLRLNFGVDYTETESLPTLTQNLASLNLANPLNPANTVQTGRQKTTLLSVTPNATYQFTPLTSGTAAFSYTDSTFQQGATNTVYTGQLAVSHQFTQRDTGTLTYIVSSFQSNGQSFQTGGTTGPTSELSNTVTIGWAHQFSPRTTISLAGGPRFSEGSVSPAVNALATHQFRLFDWPANASLGYTYSQGFIIGEPGSVNTQSVTGSVGVQPLRALQVGLGTGWSKFTGTNTNTTSSAVQDTTTYSISLTASYQILRWLSALASYSFSYQEQNGNSSSTSTTGNIPHNVVTFGIEVAYPVRVDQ